MLVVIAHVKVRHDGEAIVQDIREPDEHHRTVVGWDRGGQEERGASEFARRQHAALTWCCRRCDACGSDAGKSPGFDSYTGLAAKTRCHFL